MFGKKPQVIKFDQNNLNVDSSDNSVLFIRVSGNVTDKNAYVEISDRYNAIIVKGGGDVRYYESGNHPVFDNKTEVKDWKRGLSVDVIYIPKDVEITVKWGTPSQVEYRDDASGKIVHVGARGYAEATIANPTLFYRKVVGNMPVYTKTDFVEKVRPWITQKFKDEFSKVVEEQKLTYDRFTRELTKIGDCIGKLLSEDIEKSTGVRIPRFIIEEFFMDQKEKDAIEEAAAEKRRKEQQEEEERKKQEKLKEYLAEVERLDDKKWEREKYLHQLELQDKAAYYEVLKIVGSKPALEEEKKEDEKCPNCGMPYKPTDKFCPNCGKRVSKDPIVCPDCGKSNPYNAKFCANCGKKLINE